VYTGQARSLQLEERKREAGWVAVEGVPLLRQSEEHDCGPTALSMVLAFWKPGSEPLTAANDRQVSVGELRDWAKERGFSAYVVAGTPEDLVYELKQGRPVIVGTAKPTVKGALSHYEVVIGMHRDSQRVATLDPAAGYRQNSFTGFLTEWEATGRVLLVIVPPGAASPQPSPSTTPATSTTPHPMAAGLGAQGQAR
jgi:ABC-type bacteriocin/lantibiotic exporter with double-glycine peptidase domain